MKTIFEWGLQNPPSDFRDSGERDLALAAFVVGEIFNFSIFKDSVLILKTLYPDNKKAFESHLKAITFVENEIKREMKALGIEVKR